MEGEKIMGWAIFLLIVAGIIVIIVVRKKKKKEEHLEKFYKSAAYEVGEQIKGELVKNGYDPGEWNLWHYNSDYGFCGSLPFYTGDHKLIGSLEIDFSPKYYFTMNNFHSKNSRAMEGQFYVIVNNAIGLFATSDEESKEPPPFIAIAAKEIINSGCKFKHPDWWFENYPDDKKYLNTMFQ
jgi:hypothetical protein